MQTDIYADGFLAQKTGSSEEDNPFPLDQQPHHAVWWSGWKRGEMVTHPGPLREAIARVKSDYIAIHGSD